MIASSSPKASMALYNPALGNPNEYRFQSGQFAGMTVSEVQNFIRQRQQQLNQVTGADKKPSTVSGSSQGDQALGLVGGIGGAAALRYGISQLGNTTPALTQTGSQVASGLAPSTPTMISGGSQALANSGSTVAQGVAPTTPAVVSGGGEALSNTGGYLGNVGTVMPWLGLGANAYQVGKQGYDGYQNAVKGGEGFSQSVSNEGKNQISGGNALMAAVNPAMWFYGAQAALGGAGLGGLFGSKRAAERMARKEGRTRFQDTGLMNTDSRSRYNLADGSQFDIAKYRQDTGNQAFNVDFNDPTAGDKVGRLNAITAALIGSGKVRSDLTGELYNAYNSNGNFDQNFRAATDKLGGRNAIYQGVLDRWKNDKKFTAQERDAALAAIDKEYGIANPTGARWDAQLTGKDAERNMKELQKADQENSNKPVGAKPAPIDQRLVDSRAQAVKPFAPLPANAKPIPLSRAPKSPGFREINPRLKGKK